LRKRICATILSLGRGWETAKYLFGVWFGLAHYATKFLCTKVLMFDVSTFFFPTAELSIWLCSQLILISAYFGSWRITVILQKLHLVTTALLQTYI